MDNYTRKYEREQAMGTLVLIRVSDKASCCLQGGDAALVLQQLADIDEIWAEYGERPFGPWQCQEHHEDTLLGRYDHIMSQPQAPFGTEERGK